MRSELVGLWLSLGLLLLPSGCTIAADRTRSAAARAEQGEAAQLEPGMPIAAEDLRLLIDDVARMRGLALREPIPVDAVDQRQLDRGFDAETRWLRVGDERRQDEVDALLSRNLAGYYDPRRHRVVVRRADPSTKTESLPWRMSLAHEIEHALQHQHFAPSEDADNEDELLARRALSEGDAEVTGRLYVAGIQAQARSRALREMVERRNTEVSMLDVPSAGAGETQVRVWFPYLSGAAFAADLVRAHGFGLVDHAFGRPPVSTEQILHPNKYLEGEQPQRVPTPPIPAGYRSVAVERLGELGTRLMLAPCMDEDEAARAAEGWGGDSLRVVEGAAGEARLWSTVWDSPADAREMERALRSRACARPEVDLLVVRRGLRVVMVEGMSAGGRGKIAAEVLRQRVERVADDPLGPWRVPDLQQVAERRPGTIRGDRYRSEWLGLVSRLPRAAVATVEPEIRGTAPVELTLHTEGGGIGMVFLWPYGPTPEHSTAIVDRFVSAMKDFGEHFRHTRTETSRAPLGDGSALHFDGLRFDLHLVLVPVCRQTGTLVVARIAPKQAAPSPLDDWLQGLSWEGDGAPPMCSYLDPR